ncbi:MAG: GntR family transcriptional regulator [Oligoflexus sp.]
MQIVRQVSAQIITGSLREGEPLPSIRELARRERISVITVQKAYEELARQNLIASKRAKGFFVANLPSRSKLIRLKRKFRSLRVITKITMKEFHPLNSKLLARHKEESVKRIKKLIREVVEASLSTASMNILALRRRKPLLWITYSLTKSRQKLAKPSL